MQSSDLIRHIESLILKNDQLTLPELGTFIGSYKSASYDDNNDRFHPPSKSVLFESKMIQKDELLVHSVMANSTLEKSQIQSQISHVIAEWKQKMEQGERISIGQFGYLFQSNENKFVFRQDEYQNLLAQSYGLKPVSFITRETFIHAEEVLFEPQRPAEKIKENIEPSFTLERPLDVAKENKPSISLAEALEKEDVPVSKKAKFNKRYLIALAIAAPLAFYAYWIPVQTSTLDTGQLKLGELNPFRTTPTPEYIPEAYTSDSNEPEELSFEEKIRMLPSEVKVYNMELDEDLYIPVQLDDHGTSTADLKVDHSDQLEVKVFPISSDQNYHLIGGCFSQKSNAEAFVALMNNSGRTAFVLDYHKGLHRVSIGQYGNRTLAKDALNDYRNDGSSAWVLKKF